MAERQQLEAELKHTNALVVRYGSFALPQDRKRAQPVSRRRSVPAPVGPCRMLLSDRPKNSKAEHGWEGAGPKGEGFRGEVLIRAETILA